LESFESSLSGAAQNTWARLQGFGSAIASSLNDLYETFRPYAPYITMAAGVVLVVAGSFVTFGAAAPAGAALAGGTVAGAGMGASIGVGLGSVGLGLGLEAFAMRNLGIMNYPQQPSFEEKHTMQYTEQQTLETRASKGSGHHGEDVAEEQLEQVEITRDRIVETGGLKHTAREEKAKEWLKKQGEKEVYDHQQDQWGVRPSNSIRGKKGEIFVCRPDRVSENYILEVKIGQETDWRRCFNQAVDYLELASDINQGKTLIYWFDEKPRPGHWWGTIIDMLRDNDMNVKVIIKFGDG